MAAYIVIVISAAVIVYAFYRERKAKQNAIAYLNQTYREMGKTENELTQIDRLLATANFHHSNITRVGKISLLVSVYKRKETQA